MLIILLLAFLSSPKLYTEAPRWCFPLSWYHFIDILFSQDWHTKPYWWDFVSIAFLTFVGNAVSQHNSSFSNSFRLSERCSQSLSSRHCVLDRAVPFGQNRNTGSVHCDHLCFSSIVCLMQIRVSLMRPESYIYLQNKDKYLEYD